MDPAPSSTVLRGIGGRRSLDCAQHLSTKLLNDLRQLLFSPIKEAEKWIFE